MMLLRKRVAAAIALVTAALVLSGCTNGTKQARELAEARWEQARADVKVKLAGDELAAGNVDSAAKAATEAQHLVPEHPDLPVLQARIWLAKGNVSAAEALLAECDREGPPRAEVAYLLGVVRQQQQRWQAALGAFEKAVELEPAQVANVVAVVQVLLQLGEPQRALGFLASREDRFGWTGAYHAAVAECYEQLGRWPAAAAEWRLVANGPEVEPDLRERLAAALFRAGMYEESIEVIEPLLASIEPERSNALHLMLADACLSLGRTAAAQEAAQAVAEESQAYVAAQGLLARACAQRGDFEAALAAVDRALSKDSRDVWALELGAGVAWRAGQSSRAAEFAHRLLQIDGGNEVANTILKRTDN